MASVVTFGQLPDEEDAFLTYLRNSGDVWARAVRDVPYEPVHAPLPLHDFLVRFANELVEYGSVSVYLGFRDDILQPAVSAHEITEGGTFVPFLRAGQVVEGVQTIVGGTKVMRDFISLRASSLVRYDRGMFRSDDELAMSNLCYYSGSYSGQQWVRKPDRFLKWAKNVLDWMRRNTKESVPVHRCNYEMRATLGVAKACKTGLKLGN